MAANTGSDHSLLQRLNALQQTDISLGNPSNHVAATSKLAREDALSSRLKNLRRQVGDDPTPARNAANSPPLEPPEPLEQTGPAAQPQLTQGRTVDASQASRGVPEAADPAAGDDLGALLDTDDQTLEELLADLGSDQEWLDQVAAEEEEHQKAIALLQELSKAPPGDADTAHASEDSTGPDDDSDSEHGSIALEADDVIARALDGAHLEDGSDGQLHDTDGEQNKPRNNAAVKELNPEHPQHGKEDPFSLPVAPSELQDQPDVADDDPDFEMTMNLRMAALNVAPSTLELPSAPSADVNPLGLPGAPTFAPHDRPVPGLIKRVGYSDDDEASWCTVCLEDGTVRCLGCDGDVYCARCWKEMHIGPRAGYDERGHRWEKYIRVK